MKRVAQEFQWRTPWPADRLRAVLSDALVQVGATLTTTEPFHVEACSGRLRNVLLRSPSHWPMNITVDVAPTLPGADATVEIRDNTPWGTRLGSERSYNRGIQCMASALEARLELLEGPPG